MATTFDERANAILNDIWTDFQRASRQRELADIQANPAEHRLTRLMSKGANTGYVYWPAGERLIGETRKERTSYCVAKHKNAAGVFLLWRQVDRYRRKRGRWHWYEAARHDFQWASTKQEARQLAQRKADKAKAA